MVQNLHRLQPFFPPLKVARRRSHPEAEREEKAAQTFLGLVVLTLHQLDTGSQLLHYLLLARWVERERERESERESEGGYGGCGVCVYPAASLSTVSEVGRERKREREGERE